MGDNINIQLSCDWFKGEFPFSSSSKHGGNVGSHLRYYHFSCIVRRFFIIFFV